MVLDLVSLTKIEKIMAARKELAGADIRSDFYKNFSRSVELPPAKVAEILEVGNACLALQAPIVRKALILRYDGKKSIEVLSALHGVSRVSFYRWRKDFLIDVLIKLAGIEK